MNQTVVFVTCLREFAKERDWDQYHKGDPLRYDIDFSTNLDFTSQRNAVSVIHDEATAGDSPSNPLWVVVAMNPVYGTFARSVRQCNFKGPHIV